MAGREVPAFDLHEMLVDPIAASSELYFSFGNGRKAASAAMTASVETIVRESSPLVSSPNTPSCCLEFRLSNA